MKLCLFSDIHGNGTAFQAAFKLILAERADLNIFLGDLCGYYYDQISVFNMLMRVPNLVTVKGNHDDIFLHILAGDENLRKIYLEKYGHSMENLFAKDSTALKDWLLKLPDTYSLHDIGLTCYHGSPEDAMNGYVYPDSALDGFLNYQSTCFVLGHTHYPMKRSIKGKLIINPGSLGQARNGGWPTYAVLHYPSWKLSMKEVVYDKSILQKQIKTFGDDGRYLEKVIDRNI